MPTRSTYVVLLVLIGVGLLFAGSLNVAYQQSGQQHTVENESATVNYDSPSTLPAPDYTFTYSSSITVTVDNSTLTEGSDYTWNATSGTITWLNSSSTTDGDTALVDYQYTAPTDDTRDRRNILASLANLLPYAALAVGVFAAIELMDSGW